MGQVVILAIKTKNEERERERERVEHSLREKFVAMDYLNSQLPLFIHLKTKIQKVYKQKPKCSLIFSFSSFL